MWTLEDPGGRPCVMCGATVRVASEIITNDPLSPYFSYCALCLAQALQVATGYRVVPMLNAWDQNAAIGRQVRGDKPPRRKR